MDSLYISQSKKNAKTEQALIVHEDEASFRQSPTLHQTWAPVNSQPKILSIGARNTQKIFGAVSVNDGKFIYRHRDEMFNHETYIGFLEDILHNFIDEKNKKIYLIQDNASYHKHPDTYKWFNSNRKYIEVFNLPPYCPELNGAEKIWWYTRKQATHNRYYDSVDQLCKALYMTFETLI